MKSPFDIPTTRVRIIFDNMKSAFMSDEQKVEMIQQTLEEIYEEGIKDGKIKLERRIANMSFQDLKKAWDAAKRLYLARG